MIDQNPGILIHIGSHKTGTTSIQRFLDLNRELLLQNGILYPKTGIPDKNNLSGQHQLAWALYPRVNHKEGDLWTRLKEEMRQERPLKIVISTEDLFRPGIRIELLKGLLESNNIKIILYLRSYLGFLKASYFEAVKKNISSSGFRDFLIQRKASIDYNLRMERWSAHFGIENLIVRLYDSMEPGNGLIRDFCTIIGFDYSMAPDKTNIKLNVSVSEKSVNAIRLINKMENSLPKFISRKICFSKMRETLSNPALTPGMTEKFIRLLAGNHFCSESDIRLLKKIITETDKSLLQEMIGEPGMKLLNKGL